MQVCLTESRDHLPLDRVQWNALAAKSTTSSIFQTFEWFDTWWSAFGPRYRLFLLTVHDAGSIVGILPLMQVRRGMGLRELELVGTPNADYQNLILGDAREQAVAAICSFLYELRDRWHMLVLRNLPADSPTANDLIHGFGRLNLGFMDIERQPCAALELGGRAAEIQELLNRYSVRRSMRRLAARGTVSYCVAETTEVVDSWLPVFFEQHIRRWQGTGSPSPFNKESYRSWYRDLAQASLAAGWLHFSRLECGGKPAAFHFGFSYGRVLSWYKPSFNPDFSRESPGTTLISHLIKDASQRGLEELDFAGGLEPFKDRFGSVRRECLNLRIFTSPLLHATFIAGGHLRHGARNLWRRARGTVRHDSP
jgi:CelD/BcsL family acetyltransferase involved in cellulose biosynthesis